MDPKQPTPDDTWPVPAPSIRPDSTPPKPQPPLDVDDMFEAIWLSSEELELDLT